MLLARGFTSQRRALPSDCCLVSRPHLQGLATLFRRGFKTPILSNSLSPSYMCQPGSGAPAPTVRWLKANRLSILTEETREEKKGMGPHKTEEPTPVSPIIIIIPARAARPSRGGIVIHNDSATSSREMMIILQLMTSAS